MVHPPSDIANTIPSKDVLRDIVGNKPVFEVMSDDSIPEHWRLTYLFLENESDADGNQMSVSGYKTAFERIRAKPFSERSDIVEKRLGNTVAFLKDCMGNPGMGWAQPNTRGIITFWDEHSYDDYVPYRDRMPKF